MKKINKNYIIIILIVLGALFRLWKLGSLPWGLFRDEAALGYNAFSIWNTGKDEFGVTLPLVFRSFEVFFLPLYAYLSALLVGILGLNEFSTRMLSAISGIAALYFAYLIARKVWNKEAGIFSLLVLSVAPWHIYYSRGAFEGNLALTLFCAGFYFWISYLKENTNKNFIFSTLLFALSMYSYQAERLVVPFLAITAIILSRKKILENKQKLIFPTLVTVLLLIPLLFLSFKAGGYHRAFGVSILSKEENPPGWISGEKENIFVNNTYYLRSKQFISLYASYFSPKNLFSQGDFDMQRSVENYSVFYSFLLPFLLIGVLKLFKKAKIEEKLMIAWVFLGPLPAAFTADPFHTYRSLLFYFPITLIIGYGISTSFSYFNKIFGKIFFISLIVTVLLVNLIYFSYSYTILTQVKRAAYWDYGYKELVSYINSMGPKDKVVVFDPSTESYIHFLLFGKVNPETYHSEVARMGRLDYYYKDPSEIRPNKIGNLEFREVDWPKERGDSGKIFVFAKDLLPESEYSGDPRVKLLKKIYYPDGSIAFKIVEIN